MSLSDAHSLIDRRPVSGDRRWRQAPPTAVATSIALGQLLLFIFWFEKYFIYE